MGIAPQGVNIQPSVIYISPYGLNVSPQGAPCPPSGQGPLLPCNAHVLVRRRFVAQARSLFATCPSQSSGCACLPMQRCYVCLPAHCHVRCSAAAALGHDLRLSAQGSTSSRSSSP